MGLITAALEHELKTQGPRQLAALLQPHCADLEDRPERVRDAVLGCISQVGC